MALWAFKRTWEKVTFRWVAVDVTDRFSSDATHELSVLGTVLAAVGGSASLVAVSGGSHVMTDTYGKHLGSGYTYKLVEYPIFDLSTSLVAMFAEGFFFRLWVFGSLLYDETYCHASGGCRASRIYDVPFQSSPCHHDRIAVDAVAC